MCSSSTPSALSFFGDALHEAGLAAAADAGDCLDYPGVMVEAANLLQVVFSEE